MCEGSKEVPELQSEGLERKAVETLLATSSRVLGTRIGVSQHAQATAQAFLSLLGAAQARLKSKGRLLRMEAVTGTGDFFRPYVRL